MLSRPGLLLAALNAGIGAVLLLAGPTRHTGPAFTTPRELLAIEMWGLLFLIGGLVCALAADHGRFGAVLVGVGAGVHACWAVALLDSALRDPRAALTGVVVYSWCALVHVLTARRLAAGS